jgi:glycerol uptake facilitator protein
MKYNAYVAEFVGTFLLTLVVRLAIGSTFAIPTAVLAGLTLGLVVYMFGPVSGAHINPAVTLGLASIKKIKPSDAFVYVLCQFAGAGLASFLVSVGMLAMEVSPGVYDSQVMVAICEAMGAFILVLGVSSVVWQKTPAPAAGLTIGTALTLGATVASAGSFGVINPAVAFGLGTASFIYLLAPVVGGVAAAWGYKWIIGA